MSKYPPKGRTHPKIRLYSTGADGKRRYAHRKQFS